MRRPILFETSSATVDVAGENQAVGRQQESGNGNAWDYYFFGTAYYPEWWVSSEWEIDFREMQELGINTVRMGEFAWAIFEPAPGKFDFAWMDQAISIANKHGIDVVLGTPTAAIPPWLYQSDPNVLTGNVMGPYTYGGRKGYNTNSPHYLAASDRIVTALAEHYGGHPGVIGWQLDNEPGYPFDDFDPDSTRAFQSWLQKRYGTLEALNQAWNGAFWSNKFSDWSQIYLPKNSAEGGWQPAITLAYRRFFSDSFLSDLRRQASILRQSIKNQFIYTNWPAVTWSVSVFEGAEFLDCAAWDNYVSAPGLSPFQRQYSSGFNHDFCRSAGPKQRFFCAEQIAYVPPNVPKEGLRLQAYIDLAHGSHGQLYFEWRRPLAGGEQYRPSFIKNFDGKINPEKEVFERIGKEFGSLGPRLAHATTRSDIALLYDFPNEWAQGFWSTGQPHDRYDAGAMRYYNGIKVLQRNIDIIPLSRDFSSYKLVFAPNLRLVDDTTTKRLHEYVSGGGVLVLNYRAGTQNTDCSMRRVLPPGVFADMVGATAESKLDLLEYNDKNGQLDKNLEAELGITFSGNPVTYRPQIILELLRLHGAEVIASFRGGRMEGKAAVIENSYGRGWVIYAATDSADVGFSETLARVANAKAKLSPLIAAPYGVEVVSREETYTIYYFLLNLTESHHPAISLPQPMKDVLAGDVRVTKVALGPLEVAVLASQRGGKKAGAEYGT
ncbi:MAG: beta-galactosidase [Acidobacteriaceae bacterium]